MTGDSLFDSLTIGCNFDTKRFQKDAVRLGLVKSKPVKIDTQNPDTKKPETENQKPNQQNSKKSRPLKIYTSGHDIPAPITEFPYKLPHQAPTPVQTYSIPVLTQRRDCLVCAPTGSGKTLAFLVPVIQRLKSENLKCIYEQFKSEKSGETGDNVVKQQPKRTLILQPSKELALQTKQEFDRAKPANFDFEAHHLSAINEKIIRKLKKSPPHVILTTPNKLIHFIQSDNEEIKR